MGLRSGDWLGHSRTLMCFFLSHSFVALAVFFGSLSCWKTHPPPIFSVLAEGRRFSSNILQYMAPSIGPSVQWSRPIPLAEKQPRSMMFPPPCLTGMVFLGCDSQHFSSSKHDESSWCQRAQFWSHLTTAHSPKPSLNHSDVHWQTSDGRVHVTSWAGGPCGRCRISVHCGVVCYQWFAVVPTALKSLTISFCVVLGWSLTFLMIILTPWGEIMHGAPDWGLLMVILYFFHFQIIAPTVVSFSPSFLLMVL